MPNRADRLALIERVEKATEPDRELGRELLLAGGWNKDLYGYFYGPLYMWSSPDRSIIFKDDDFRDHDPTGSVDAALAFMEGVLPGWAVAMERWKSECSAKLWECDDKGWHRGGTGRSEAIAATLHRAIIAATLRAMQTGE